jgi:hypothetical protein
MKAWLKTHKPKIGKQGKEIQSNVTDHESAKMSTSHGGLQGYNGQALVDAAYQVIVHAAAFGNGQDYDHVAPMMARAKATMQALGYGEDYFAETVFLADSNYHSDSNLKSCDRSTLTSIFRTATSASGIRVLRRRSATSLRSAIWSPGWISGIMRPRIGTSAPMARNCGWRPVRITGGLVFTGGNIGGIWRRRRIVRPARCGRSASDSKAQR